MDPVWRLGHGRRSSAHGRPPRPVHAAPTFPLALPPAKPARRRGCQCKGYLSKDRKLPWEHKARFNFLKTLKRLMIRKGNAHLAEKEGMETEVTVTFHLWFTCGASLPIHLGPGRPSAVGSAVLGPRLRPPHPPLPPGPMAVPGTRWCHLQATRSSAFCVNGFNTVWLGTRS